MANGGREQRTISRLERRPANLTVQDIELVAEDHQLDVLDICATTAANKRAEQSPKSEVEQAEEHAPASCLGRDERGHEGAGPGLERFGDTLSKDRVQRGAEQPGARTGVRFPHVKD